MRQVTFILVILMFVVSSCKQENKKYQVDKVTIENIKDSLNISSKFFIEILDKKALGIISPDTKIQILASGFEWTEGPLWIENGQYLLFSDIPNNKVYKLNTQNDTTTYLHPSGFTGENFTGAEPGSNGLLLNPSGELVLMQHGDRQVGKMNALLTNSNEDYTTLINNYKGKRLNSPNDGVFDKNGNLYFTDPPYGLSTSSIDDPVKELDFQGVYCLLKSGELVLIDDKIKYPNGIGVSPDGTSLYVAESNVLKLVWYEYDIVLPGKVENKRIFYEVTHLLGKKGEKGLPDGLKINKNGIIFATGPDGVWVFNPEAEVLARIHTGQLTANCAFNSSQNKLFMTADNYILAVDLK